MRTRPSIRNATNQGLTLIWLMVAMVATGARGGMGWNWYNEVNPNNVVGEVQIVNDSDGAVYNSYEIMLADLANQIFSNNPSLHGTYVSGADLVANGVFNYNISPNGEVYGGWRKEIQTNGDANITHTEGIPNLSWDVWYATQQNAGQDMQRGTLNVAKGFLDLDGDGWTTNDLRIGNDTNQIVVGGVGVSQDGFSIWPDTISRIVVELPERAVAVDSTHGWFGTNTIGNPTGAGVYPYGSAVTVSVDRIVVDPENPGRRLRVTGVTVE